MEQVVVRDVVVVVPGIMGTELLDASGRPVWSLRARSLITALRTLGGSLRKLELPAGIGDGPAPGGIRPGDLLHGLHVIPGVWSPISGYAALLRFLRSPRFHLVEADPQQPDLIPNLLTFGYDWRLSNRHNARLLKDRALAALDRWQEQAGMEDAKLVLICHSMGGLVAQWFAECEGGAEHTRAIVTIGTPYRGALKALETLTNGLERGVAPIRLDLSRLVRSMPSMFQLLPTYDCLVGADGRRASLAETAVSQLNATMLADAKQLHDRLAGTDGPGDYKLHKVVGIRQPTLTTATLSADGVLAAFDIDGLHQGGDGTVPRLAAEPVHGRGLEVHEVADQHGELQAARSTFDLIDGIITREAIIWEDAAAEGFGVGMRDLWDPHETPELHVPDLADRRLVVTIRDEAGAQVGPPVPVRPDGRATLGPLPPGGYRAHVASPLRGGPSPVTVPFVVWDPATDPAVN